VKNGLLVPNLGYGHISFKVVVIYKSIMPIAYISLNKAKVGMKLAEDLYTNDGTMILCKKDTVLTDNIIQRLENRGVEKIAVEQTLSEEEKKLLLEEKLNLINNAFKDKEGDCVNMLKDAFIELWKRKFEE